nr:MAG TPA: hypothetical protein [Caudoviricetes sp.]
MAKIKSTFYSAFLSYKKIKKILKVCRVVNIFL